MDCSLSGFSVHGIFQARVLEWVAISFSNEHQDAFKIHYSLSLPCSISSTSSTQIAAAFWNLLSFLVLKPGQKLSTTRSLHGSPPSPLALAAQFTTPHLSLVSSSTGWHLGFSPCTIQESPDTSAISMNPSSLKGRGNGHRLRITIQCVFLFLFSFLFQGPTEKFIFKRMPLILSILNGASGTKL